LSIAWFYGHREVALMLLATGVQVTDRVQEKAANKYPHVLKLFTLPLPAEEVVTARAKVQERREEMR
jgi:hypothetical protein